MLSKPPAPSSVESKLREGFGIPNSRFVVIMEGVPIGAEFQSEALSIIRFMAENGIHATYHDGEPWPEFSKTGRKIEGIKHARIS